MTAGLAIGFSVLFAMTAEWSLSANVDATAAALPGWSLATNGNLALDQFAGLNPWLVDSELGVVSNRPPGMILVALPGYLIARPDRFTNVPATATAVVVTVLFLLTLHRLLLRLVDRRTALVAVLVMGLGTATWSVSSGQLWPHGPGQLLAATALMAAQSRLQLRTGLTFAAALLVRPVTAFAGATYGVMESVRSRKLQPAISIATPMAVALAGLVLYNRAVFGEWSVVGGYPSSFASRLVTAGTGTPYLNNLGRMFFSPENGLFVWSPVVLFALIGLVAAWSRVPGWARSAAIAAAVYLLIHAKLNRASGGAAFGYRYPLEALALAAPALVIGAKAIADRSRMMRSLMGLAIVISVAAQVALVFFLDCEAGIGLVDCSFR